MMHIRRLLLVMLSIIVLATWAIPAAAEVRYITVRETRNEPLMQVGVHFSNSPFGGITIKKRVSSNTIVQGTFVLTESHSSFSGRLLLDLGTKGNVFRYMGVGAAVGGEDYWGDPNTPYQATLAGVEGFIGIDYPLEWFDRATPFSSSFEVGVQGVARLENGVSRFMPRSGVNWGLSYWF